jgi:hypothetical protein
MVSINFVKTPQNRYFKILLAATSYSTWTESPRERERETEGCNIIYLTTASCNFANIPESNPAEFKINPLSIALQSVCVCVCVCVCVVAKSLENCFAEYRHVSDRNSIQCPLKMSGSVTPLHLYVFMAHTG